MICHIDASNGIPIYEQIERQLKFAVAGGTLLPGERVPSVREMARQTAVNVNTVARAYRQLQDQGVLHSIRGTGLAVSTEAPDICTAARRELIQRRLRSALEEAFQSQMSISDIQALVATECSRLAGDGETTS